MDFKNDIKKINPIKKKTTINICEEKIPLFLDTYYISKKYEIYNRCSEARMFLRWSYDDNIKGWFLEHEKNKVNTYMKEIKKRMCCEIALTLYCDIVDIITLSCYIICESYGTSNKNPLSCEEARKLIKEFEKGNYESLSNFASNNRRLNNLKKLCIEFHDDKHTNKILSYNNIIKHRELPFYEEEEKYQVHSTGDIFYGEKRIPIDSSDIRKHIKVSHIQKSLINFDNEVLFEFLMKYYRRLDGLIKPSKYVCP